MSNTIDISGIDKAAVLAALYNASKQQRMGFLHQRGASPMTTHEARQELENGSDFDYLHGRVMKVSLNKDTLDPYGYDRDNGPGAATRALEHLLSAKSSKIGKCQ